MDYFLHSSDYSTFISGMTITYLCWGCLAVLPDLYPHFFLLCSLPVSLTGGTCAVFLSIYCYITDVTDDVTRPLRSVSEQDSIRTSTHTHFAVNLILITDTRMAQTIVFSYIIKLLGLKDSPTDSPREMCTHFSVLYPMKRIIKLKLSI